MTDNEGQAQDGSVERDPANLDQELPPERIAEIERFLADKWGKCPMCDDNRWVVTSRLLPLPAGGESRFIVAPVLCATCSFSAMVNLVHAKLLSS